MTKSIKNKNKNHIYINIKDKKNIRHDLISLKIQNNIFLLIFLHVFLGLITNLLKL
jgi:hypothetical protein